MVGTSPVSDLGENGAVTSELICPSSIEPGHPSPESDRPHPEAPTRRRCPDPQTYKFHSSVASEMLSDAQQVAAAWQSLLCRLVRPHPDGVGRRSAWQM
mmetsp:Transcript_46627/g.72995  ORF Transcript_46627/g.72995 Transcript_46627/m.72995 type:complete len:99 (-) Transcript_46627:72-368(-)